MIFLFYLLTEITTETHMLALLDTAICTLLVSYWTFFIILIIAAIINGAGHECVLADKRAAERKALLLANKNATEKNF